MKLSSRTLQILSSFAEINKGIWLRAGKFQHTIEAEGNGVYARAQLDEFPIDFGIIELRPFVATLMNLEEPELDFQQDEKVNEYGHISINRHVYVKDKNNVRIVYSGVSRNLIVAPPDDAEMKAFESAAECILKWEYITQIKKFALVNDLPHFILKSTGKALCIEAADGQDDCPTLRIIRPIGPCEKEFEMVFQIKYLKALVKSDYIVKLAVGEVANFKSQDDMVDYWMMPTIFKNARRVRDSGIEDTEIS